MNRMYRQFQYGLENKVVTLFLKVAVGAAGAPTISSSLSKGIASIARNSAGKYTITLQDPYVGLLQFTQSKEKASGSPAGLGGCVVRSVDTVTAKTIVIENLDTSGVAEELASGTTLRIKIDLKASGV
jgi:hypothetical protein